MSMGGAAFSPAGDFRIKSLRKGVVPLTPAVTGFRLYGLTKTGAEASIHNATMEIESRSGDLFVVSIVNGPPLPYYEDGNNGTLVPTYVFTYSHMGHPIQDLCVGGLEPREAIVFQGDRYDVTTGALVAVGQAAHPWFNIACKEDALWKLALMRHVEAAQDPTHITTVDDRNAGIRAIRADYCGTGVPMTELGVQVDWANRGLWLTIQPDPRLEAIWTGAGALCVDRPRLVDLADIPCPVASCDDYIDDWPNVGSFVTYAPEL